MSIPFAEGCFPGEGRGAVAPVIVIEDSFSNEHLGTWAPAFAGEDEWAYVLEGYDRQ